MGIHRFYCGKVVTGLLWLFTGGLFMIGWIIDFFLVPSMVREANMVCVGNLQVNSLKKT